MISDSDLIAYNFKGFIVGPFEKEADFLERIEGILYLSSVVSSISLLKNLSHSDRSMIPPKFKELFDEIYAFFTKRKNLEGGGVTLEAVKEEEKRESVLMTIRLFDFSTSWLVAFYCNKGLALWQGAATWVFDGKFPILQLRSGFQKSSFSKIYTRSEVLAHESVHAARMVFEENRFEEMLAYKTSKNSVRSWMGPFFSSPWKSYLFIFGLLTPLTVQINSLFLELKSPLSLLFYLPALPSVFCFFHLLKIHFQFKQCKKHLKDLLDDPAFVLPVLLRLTDDEIVFFAKSSSNEILQYIHKEYHKLQSLRWRQIVLSYFRNIVRPLA